MRIEAIRAAFFAAAVLPVFPALSQELPIKPAEGSQQEGGTTATSAPTIELDKLVYRDQLIQAWQNDPQLYQAMRDVAHNPGAVQQWEKQFRLIEAENRRLAEQAGNSSAFIAKTPGDILLNSTTVIESAERDALQLQRRRAQEDAAGRSEMLEEWSEAMRLASDYADLMYDSKQGNDVGLDKYLVDFVTDAVRPQLDTFPDVVSYDVLIARANGASDVLTRLGLSIEDVGRIRRGEATVEQALAGSGKSKEEIQSSIVQIYQEQTALVVNAPPTGGKFTPRDERIQQYETLIQQYDAALADPSDKTLAQLTALTEQREEIDAAKIRLEVEAHLESSQKARAYASATTSVATLLFGTSEEIQDISTAVSAGIDLYESVGSMIITGALDPTGIATAASAINMVSGLFKGKKPDPTIAMLKKVLENQRIMIEKLTRIESKVDVLLEKSHEMLARLDAIRIQIDKGFTQTLDRINSLDRYAFVRDQLFAQQELIRDEERHIGDVLKPFRERQGILFESAVKCMLKQGCDANANEQFNKIYGSSGTLREHAVRSLSEDAAFVQRKDFLTSDLQTLREDHFKQSEQMLGQLSSMAIWLNEQSPKTPASISVTADRFGGVAHPYYLTDFYIPQYVELVTHLPENYKAYGETPDARDLIREFNKVEDAASEARRATPVPIDIYKQSYWPLIERAGAYIKAALDDRTERPDKYFTLPQLIDQDPALEALFLSASDENIRAHFDAMGSMEFAELGIRMGLFEIKEAFEDEGSSEPGAQIVMNAKYRYIQLTQKAQSIFGGPLPTSYFKVAERGQIIYIVHAQQGILTDNGAMFTGKLKETGPVELKPDPVQRKPIVDIFVNEVLARRAAAFASWRDHLGAEAGLYAALHLMTVRASLTATTFINAGYGNCVDYLSDLEPLREIKTTLANEKPFENLMNAVDLIQLKTAKDQAEARLKALPLIPETPAAFAGCSLGWGELPKARRALERLASYSFEPVPQ